MSQDNTNTDHDSSSSFWWRDLAESTNRDLAQVGSHLNADNIEHIPAEIDDLDLPQADTAAVALPVANNQETKAQESAAWVEVNRSEEKSNTTPWHNTAAYRRLPDHATASGITDAQSADGSVEAQCASHISTRSQPKPGREG